MISQKNRKDEIIKKSQENLYMTGLSRAHKIMGSLPRHITGFDELVNHVSKVDLETWEAFDEHPDIEELADYMERVDSGSQPWDWYNQGVEVAVRQAFGMTN